MICAGVEAGVKMAGRPRWFTTHSAMKPRNGWGTESSCWGESGWLRFVVSHPIRDEAAEWMGHGAVTSTG